MPMPGRSRRRLAGLRSRQRRLLAGMLPRLVAARRPARLQRLTGPRPRRGGRKEAEGGREEGSLGKEGEEA
jgi:hypothetical protein